MTDKQPAEALYQQLKQDIRDNKLPIASPLKQEQLAANYGVSRIPVRDVLQRLKNEGWWYFNAHSKISFNGVQRSHT